VGVGVSDMRKWASEFQVEQSLYPLSGMQLSVGEAACPAVIHGQDIDSGMDAHRWAPGRCLNPYPSSGPQSAANEGGTARHKLRPLFCSLPGNGIKDEAFFIRYLYKLTKHLHENVEGRNNLKKRSDRLYHQIFTFVDLNQKNRGITAIGRLFCHRSGKCK